MTQQLERSVARHYGVPDLAQRILDAVVASGLDPERLAPEQLAPIDEFHIGGRAATEHVVGKLALAETDKVLDVGSGLGGTARYLASAIGCEVTGIDLTPDYVETARLLAERTGLGGRVSFRTASALEMPFDAASFDAAVTFHVAMNIRDRAGLYREIARVLKPGGTFCIYDVMQGPSAELRFPVPWAEGPETSHLTMPAEMRRLLTESGFQVEQEEDRTGFGIDFFRQRLAAAGPPPPLGLHLLMGPQARVKFENMLWGLEHGCIAPVIMVARRLGKDS